MIFTTPAWTPQIASIPDSIPIADFVMKRDHVLYRWSDHEPTWVCALSGKSYNMSIIRERVKALLSSLCRDLHWLPNDGSPSDKVIGIFCSNTVCFFLFCSFIYFLSFLFLARKRSIFPAADRGWLTIKNKKNTQILDWLSDYRMGDPSSGRNLFAPAPNKLGSGNQKTRRLGSMQGYVHLSRVAIHMQWSSGFGRVGHLSSRSA